MTHRVHAFFPAPLSLLGQNDEFLSSARLRGLVSRSGVACVNVGHDFGYAGLGACRRACVPCGHPWAALVCFDAVLTALLLGFDAVAVGNERSANFGNGVDASATCLLSRAECWRRALATRKRCDVCALCVSGIFLGGSEVNHQFDKSFAFERAANDYIAQHLLATEPGVDVGVHYFSALQPLWEVQIAWLFARIPSSLAQPAPGERSPGERCECSASGHPFLALFISCNENKGLLSWCGRCDKCAFVWALLAAWVPTDELAATVFGG